ncbi:hypothetical protein ETW24_03110 [Leisingera sp. NJS204]|nr:hypothetical protein ETW24_03110 [Leisingera sp. NJS204]
MKTLIPALALAGALLSPAALFASTLEPAGIVRQGIVMHGGGCRKSSPPGQCCHMETATGTVHCH